MILANFESGSLGQEKLEKVIEKVMDLKSLKEYEPCPETSRVVPWTSVLLNIMRYGVYDCETNGFDIFFLQS